MRITYHKDANRYVVTYTEIDLLDYITQVYQAEYHIAFDALAFMGRFYPALLVETDTCGARFLIVENHLRRTFYTTTILAEHGLDLLPWYAISKQRWEIEIDPGDGRPFWIDNQDWGRLRARNNLGELRRTT